MKKDSTPVAYILCYTIRRNLRDTIRDYDYWEIFPEYDEDDNTPEQQAQQRLNELKASYDNDETNDEVYTWNIARLVKTNEWYGIEQNKKVKK